MANEPRIDLTYHGSTRRHKVATVLVGEPRETEFSGRVSRDGVGFEELVESLRPEQAPSRLQGLFSTPRAQDLNLVGAAEDYVYAVRPLGRVAVVYFAWLSEVLGMFWSGVPARGNQKMAALIKRYWSGAYPSFKGRYEPPEVISDAVEFVEQFRKPSTTKRAARSNRSP